MCWEEYASLALLAVSVMNTRDTTQLMYKMYLGIEELQPQITKINSW